MTAVMETVEEGENGSLYPIAVLIDELRNEDVQLRFFMLFCVNEYMYVQM